MKHLYLVRHGLSENNTQNKWSGHSDTPLVSDGHEQAKQAGKIAKAQNLHFDVIVSSPLQRARHTAEHIARETGYPVENIIFSDLLKERNFGELEGKRNDHVRTKYLTHGEHILDEYEGVESLEAMHERAAKALAYLQSLSGDTILVVTHGAFGRALRRQVTGEPMHVRMVSYKNAEIVKLI